MSNKVKTLFKKLSATKEKHLLDIIIHNLQCNLKGVKYFRIIIKAEKLNKQETDKIRYDPTQNPIPINWQTGFIMRMYQTKTGYIAKNFKISLFDVSNFAYRKRICYRYVSYEDLMEIQQVNNLTITLDKGKTPGAQVQISAKITNKEQKQPVEVSVVERQSGRLSVMDPSTSQSINDPYQRQNSLVQEQEPDEKPIRRQNSEIIRPERLKKRGSQLETVPERRGKYSSSEEEESEEEEDDKRKYSRKQHETQGRQRPNGDDRQIKQRRKKYYSSSSEEEEAPRKSKQSPSRTKSYFQDDRRSNQKQEKRNEPPRKKNQEPYNPYEWDNPIISQKSPNNLQPNKGVLKRSVAGSTFSHRDFKNTGGGCSNCSVI